MEVDCSAARAASLSALLAPGKVPNSSAAARLKAPRVLMAVP